MSWAELRGDVVIVACAVSAGIHAALAPDHFAEGAAAGLGFAVAAVLLAGLCVALTARPEEVIPVAAAAAVLVGLLAGYALAVTVGVPILDPQTEHVDGLALATKGFELVGLAAALDVIRAPATVRPTGGRGFCANGAG